MAGIVRKLFKTAGGGSSRKKREEQFDDGDDEGDYSEVHFAPTTSTPSTPSRAFKTPKIRHDETISEDDNDEDEESDDVKDFRKFPKFTRPSEDVQKDQQQLQIRHENKPSLKRRRHQNPYGSTSSMASRMFQNEEDSIYEHTQYQLMAYGRQVERHDAKRRKRREERQLEQENRVYQGMGGISFREEDTVDVGKLRMERDQWKREAERYKERCAELEKRIKEMKQFQPFPINNAFTNPVFPSQAPPPTFLFQATPLGGAAGGGFNFATSNFGANLNFAPNFAPNFNPNFSFAATQATPTTSQAPPTTTMATSSVRESGRGPAPFPNFEAIGPIGPMAPRFPDPVDDSLCFEDDDTSLSDLSNSSKSSEEGGNLN